METERMLGEGVSQLIEAGLIELCNQKQFF